MSIDTRLSRLAPSLTAQERAILVLEAWKGDRAEDPTWRKYMPREQALAFNHYIDLMNKANRVLGSMINALILQAEKIEVRQAWLVGLTLWQEHVDEIRRAVRLAVKEPITRSEYEAKVQATRSQWVPLSQLAEFLAGQRTDWSEDDYQDAEDGGQEISDEAWDRAVSEEEQKLRALVSAGKLPSRGKGKALKLQEDALRSFGHTVGAAPDDFLSYRLVADDEAEEVERERDMLQRLLRVLDWQPFHGPPDPELATYPEKMRQGLRETIAYQLITVWVELHCVDVLVEEIRESFNGVDPLKPSLRAKLDGTREKLQATRDQMQALNAEIVLREPLKEELDEMRTWLNDIPSESL